MEKHRLRSKVAYASLRRPTLQPECRQGRSRKNEESVIRLGKRGIVWVFASEHVNVGTRLSRTRRFVYRAAPHTLGS